ncbi:MAG: ATP-binding protein, partial [Desulfobulbaceae bacterium]|nr:ATP-binding protein [Desulfobulbaceae bacterium]
NEALKLLRASIPTSIEIKTDIKECGMVLANPTQLHQILMNLCTNGYQAMRDKGGTLGVSLKSVVIDSSDTIKNVVLKPGRYLCLEVSDTGVGIESEILPKIFDPYFTTKAKGEGTGMGLSVVHGIVKSHGGHITVYSEPNKGSVFKVYLPEIEREAITVEHTDAKDIPRGSERLMIVDDENAIMELEKKYLENLGYLVRGFTDPSLAWKAFDATPRDFDLVLTDMTMPKLTGDRLSLKILEKRPNIPIILCTGFSEIINEEKAQAIGVKYFLTKPIIFRELSVTVRNILDAAHEKSNLHI